MLSHLVYIVFKISFIDSFVKFGKLQNRDALIVRAFTIPFRSVKCKLNIVIVLSVVYLCKLCVYKKLENP
jgi:NAD/NADP transhydrogenase beta subunit